MEKVRPWRGQLSDRGRLKNRTEQNCYWTVYRYFTKSSPLPTYYTVRSECLPWAQNYSYATDTRYIFYRDVAIYRSTGDATPLTALYRRLAEYPSQVQQVAAAVRVGDDGYVADALSTQARGQLVVGDPASVPQPTDGRLEPVDTCAAAAARVVAPPSPRPGNVAVRAPASDRPERRERARRRPTISMHLLLLLVVVVMV